MPGPSPSPPASIPDALPVTGRAPACANAFLAFGHGHLGLTLAAVTGTAIADLAAGRTPAFDPAPFGAGRFGAPAAGAA